MTNNYREVMISTSFFKVSEYCHLPLLERLIEISPSQFSYRVQPSTSVAVALMKEIIGEYTAKRSAVHVCFLDTSKADCQFNFNIYQEKLFN